MQNSTYNLLIKDYVSNYLNAQLQKPNLVSHKLSQPSWELKYSPQDYTMTTNDPPVIPVITVFSQGNLSLLSLQRAVAVTLLKAL